MSIKKTLDGSKRELRKIEKIFEEVDALSETFKEMSDQELQAQTTVFKTRYDHGESLDDLLPEAFAAIREADRRVLGLYPYKVQVIGGIVLHQGNLAEMHTGEGKTLTETMPVYLNAITGDGVHVVTVNPYLSKRDAEEMGQVFTWMGLSVGVNTEDMGKQEKKEAYACDITYSTNDELAFDYLRDNMALFKDDTVQRGLNHVIVDEADSILIDEARTPLIISGSEKSYSVLLSLCDRTAKSLAADDYFVDEETRTVSLNPSGVEKFNRALGVRNLYDKNNFADAHYASQAMKANYVMEKDKDYIVKDDAVMIVDTFTGRVQPDRRFSDGLHQAIEAKEGVAIKDASQTEASITYQNFFRMYNKLSGMTGTAATDAEEFYDTYHMKVVKIPTNNPIARIDYSDIMYPTERAKYQAAVKVIESVHEKRQPILVGTASVDNSERLSKLLTEQHIPHEVLNAKNHAKEAEIVMMAGQPGAVTIATNMAGRGTDIKLGPGVKELGGLFVLGTEKHESRRIDDQLRGRAGRQGDPGKTLFLLSLEDELIKRFGNEKVDKVKNKLIERGLEYEPIKSKIVLKSMDAAQKRVEGNNFDERKNTLSYDDVIREERESVYGERQKIISGDQSLDLDAILLSKFAKTIQRNVSKVWPDSKKNKAPDNLDALVNFSSSMLGITVTDEDILKMKSRKDFKEFLFEMACHELENKRKALFNAEQLRDFEKILLLNAIDVNWKENMDNMEQLRMSITLRGYGQQNPLVEYKNSSVEMFEEMAADISDDVTRHFMRAEIRKG